MLKYCCIVVGEKRAEARDESGMNVPNLFKHLGARTDWSCQLLLTVMERQVAVVMKRRVKKGAFVIIAGCM